MPSTSETKHKPIVEYEASKRKGYKAEVLIALFRAKYDPNAPQDIIEIPIQEVVEYLDQNGKKRPGNIHNFFKDLVRTGKLPRQLAEIAEQGYQIVQKDKGGAFVKSNREELSDTIDLPESLRPVEINSNGIPRLAFELVRTDEGGAISVVEYCGLLGIVVGAQVCRVQTPLKVQPNEIDGCYICKKNNKRTLLSVEAKSKGSDVLLERIPTSFTDSSCKFA